MNVYADLFVTFAKIGGLTFGGGYAMLPMLDREVVEKRQWATNEQIMDYYAVGQCTPGIIAVNTATFVGYSVAGDLGGIAATLGVVFPSLVIITLIAGILNNFANYPIVQHAFAGIRVCVCVLIFNAVVKLWKSGVKDRFCLIMCLAVMALSFFFNLSPIIFVVVCAAAGILIKTVGTKQEVNNK